MQKTFNRKYLPLCLVLGLAGFLLTSWLGTIVLEHIEKQTVSQSLYQEATTLASDTMLRYQASSENFSSLYSTLSSVAKGQHTQIWIADSEGRIVLDTDNPQISAENPFTIPDFSPASWGNSYYRVGNFYNHFSEERMSVIATITADMQVKGYVLFHYSMSRIYKTRDRLLTLLLITYWFVYLIFLVILIVLVRKLYKPLDIILTGATEMAGGNLSYRIPLDDDSELGYLANTLNYMADRMHQNSQFQRNYISNISHDFRSPLTSIKGYVEAMLDGTIPPEMQEKYLTIVSYEADRLEKLTRSIITLNNMDTQKRMMIQTDFDINDTIRKTAATFEVLCRSKNIQLSLLLQGESLCAHADQEQIQLILYNLIDNAVKFSSDNTTITIETTEKGGKIFVSVKDRGLGIAKEELSRIWDRFYKTDSSRGKDRTGTGLGLSIVRDIIKAHGQNINVVSTEGVGTEFIFTLDVSQEHS